MITSLYKTINRFKPSETNPLYLALDGSRKNNWRTHFYQVKSQNIPVYSQSGATYKGNRIKDESFDWNEIFLVLENLIEVLDKHTNIRVVKHDSAEADDIIYVGSRLYPTSTIISSDKDFKQLITDKCNLFDPLKDKHIILDMSPEEYLRVHIIIGDKSDNILPIKKGIGKKRALALTPAKLKSLFSIEPELEEKYMFNKTLIDLRELPQDIYDEIVVKFGESNRVGKYNFSALIEFCQEHNLSNVSNNLNKFNF